jgi:hypothetical protein
VLSPGTVRVNCPKLLGSLLVVVVHVDRAQTLPVVESTAVTVEPPIAEDETALAPGFKVAVEPLALPEMVAVGPEAGEPPPPHAANIKASATIMANNNAFIIIVPSTFFIMPFLLTTLIPN